MKKVISNKEIVKKAKKWVESFTFNEFSKMLKEEIFFSELYDLNNSEWLFETSPTVEIEKTKYDTSIVKDERKNWASLEEYNKNKKVVAPVVIKDNYDKSPISKNAARIA